MSLIKVKWFHHFGKSNFLISQYETKSIQIQNSCIKASFSEELLGIEIDNNLSFHEHSVLIVNFEQTPLIVIVF